MRKLKTVLTLSILFFAVSFVVAQKDIDKGIEFFDLGEYATAKDYLKSGYTKMKGDKVKKAEVTFLIAECYRHMKNVKLAQTWYKKAIKRGYKDPVAILNYADMLKMNERYDDAVAQYKLYREKVPSDERGEYGVKSCELASVWKKNPTRHKVEAMAYFNDRETDFCPAFAKKDYKTIYFSSAREGVIGDKLSDISGIYYTDIFRTSKDRKGKWSIPEPLGPPVNTEFDEGGCCLNKKANTIFFSRCIEVKHEVKGCQIYTATKKGQNWGEPTLIPIVADSFDIKFPSISKNEKTLMFSADIPGGYGGKDIWMITRPKKTKPFGEPINLGPEINTYGNEAYPFIYNDSIIYFASDEHLGMGGLDIFKATLQKDGKWKVENMQYPINTSSDDFALIMEDKREAGFFTSYRPGGKGGADIYYYEVPELKFATKGLIINSETETPIVGATVKIIGDNGYMREMKSEADGSFLFKKIPEGGDYVVSAVYDGFLLNKFSFSTKDLDENKTWTSNISLEKIVINVARDIADIYYDFNKATLRPESMVALDSLVTFMEDNIKITVEIMSHTDFRGKDEANLKLSDARAKSVVDYLKSKGIEADRLKWHGYGESVPHVVTAKDAAEYSFLKEGDELSVDFINKLKSKDEKEICHQLNRRTQFKILSSDFETQKEQLIIPQEPKDDGSDEGDY